ncbi:MAG: hypothetical protein RL662_1651 [Bacteroidota bacterium]|jgi:outer membrane protein assembly factor BamA
MRSSAYFVFTVLIAGSLLSSCNTTKGIPEGKYLLDDYNIKADTRKIDVTYFEDFIRQNPNSRLKLGIYNMAGQDTSKWMNRFLKKMGQPPVIYNAQQTKISATQIAKELSNQGYLRAEVDTVLKVKGKKMTVEYKIKNNGIYTIRNYEYTIDNKEIDKRLERVKRYSRVQQGSVFNQENIETSRTNLTTYLRNIGYYNFTKEHLYFKADTTLNSNQVDLFLSVHQPKDSTSFKRYKIRNVTVLSGFDPTIRGNQRIFAKPDTVNYKGLKLIYGKNNFLRGSTLYRNTYLRPDRVYSDMDYTRTMGAFNGIGVVKQTAISFKPAEHKTNDSIQYIDAQVTIAPGNTHFFQTEIQGTNSAGDLGISPSITYQHQNLFNGAEILKVRLRGAYEFISNPKFADIVDKNYYEYGGDISLSFPLFLFPWLKKSWREQPSASTQILFGLNNQSREAYTRQFFNAALTYRWTSKQNKLSHALSLWNINYVRMPWASEDFKKNYLENTLNVNAMVRESYKDQLISSTTYGITLVNSSGIYERTPRIQTVVRANVDISGLLPRLATSLHTAQRDSISGHKQVLGIAYAEYLKGEVSLAQTRRLNGRTSFAYRFGLGVAKPFGNSSVLPFETRFFSGGANSVRGWSTRQLGPGSYSLPTDSTNLVNQVGDIKLDMSIEYRRKTSDFVELAAFVDAGNIWSMNDYKEQPEGQFKFSKFYKQMALAYGLGFRYDLSFLLIRLDFGARAYDPARQEGERWVVLKPSFRRMAWHFAIGYPF